jgi:hypothetical protein
MELGMQAPVIPTANGSRSGSAFSRFVLKTGFVLFLTVDISIGFLYLLFTKSFRWVEVIPSALAVFSGLTAGTLARVFYKKSARIIRWVMACLVIALTLALAGLVVQEWIRVDLTGIWFVLVKPDFAILTGMGWITAFLAIFAWPGKNKVTPVEAVTPAQNNVTTQYEMPPLSVTPRRTTNTRKVSTSQRRSFSIIPKDVRKRIFRKNNLQRWLKKSGTNISRFIQKVEKNGLKPIRSLFNQSLAARPRGLMQSTRLAAQPAAMRTSSPALSPMPLPRKRLGRKMQNPIRLVGREEMRCPYCLQIVERNDPHGIVVCPICKSAHHKECWDITGSCQVPHNHAVL